MIDMGSGGARSRSGPLRDPNALRRDRPSDKAGWTVLPAEGREGLAPEWPLFEQSEEEAALWDRYWRKPQAVIWERDQVVEYVARFVRQFVEAQEPRASAVNRQTVRMMEQDLYLTPDAMARARVRIGEVAPAEAPAPEAPRRASARTRLKVVVSDGDGA